MKDKKKKMSRWGSGLVVFLGIFLGLAISVWAFGLGYKSNGQILYASDWNSLTGAVGELHSRIDALNAETVGNVANCRQAKIAKGGGCPGGYATLPSDSNWTISYCVRIVGC